MSLGGGGGEDRTRGERGRARDVDGVGGGGDFVDTVGVVEGVVNVRGVQECTVFNQWQNLDQSFFHRINKLLFLAQLLFCCIVSNFSKNMKEGDIKKQRWRE